MTPAMEIKSSRSPYWHGSIERVDDGGSRITINGNFVQVRVFTYAGGVHGSAFTRLDLYVGEYDYSCCLPRHYHDRWLLRLALAFECRCWNDAKSKGYV
ncbi:MAG TPA: hypothetical protein VF595_17510 [Tepidisphaeraceae bacterium]|jgi:hypothetical protein